MAQSAERPFDGSFGAFKSRVSQLSGAAMSADLPREYLRGISEMQRAVMAIPDYQDIQVLLRFVAAASDTVGGIKPVKSRFHKVLKGVTKWQKGISGISTKLQNVPVNYGDVGRGGFRGAGFRGAGFRGGMRGRGRGRGGRGGANGGGSRRMQCFHCSKWFLVSEKHFADICEEKCNKNPCSHGRPQCA